MSETPTDPSVQPPAAPPVEAPAASEESPAEAEHFWKQVRRLPTKQAQAVALHYLEDMSVNDIADVLDCSPNTVKVHLHKGRRTLAERLDVALGGDV